MPRAVSALRPGGGTRLWRRRRMWILRRDGAQCVLCGGRERLEVDHIRPRAQGGGDEASNLRSVCHDCHAVLKLQEQGVTLIP